MPRSNYRLGRRRFPPDTITSTTASAISKRSGNGPRRHDAVTTSRTRRRLRDMVKGGRAELKFEKVSRQRRDWGCGCAACGYGGQVPIPV